MYVSMCRAKERRETERARVSQKGTERSTCADRKSASARIRAFQKRILIAVQALSSYAIPDSITLKAQQQ